MPHLLLLMTSSLKMLILLWPLLTSTQSRRVALSTVSSIIRLISTDYYHYLVVPLQVALDREILKMATNNTALEYEPSTSSYPHPELLTQDIVAAAGKYLLCVPCDVGVLTSSFYILCYFP
jgi:hypothetical protein